MVAMVFEAIPALFVYVPSVLDENSTFRLKRKFQEYGWETEGNLGLINEEALLSAQRMKTQFRFSFCSSLVSICGLCFFSHGQFL